MNRTRWGAIVVGAAAGLGLTAIVVVLLFLAGLRPERTLEGVVFIFMQFVGQLVAGVVAGRLSRPLAAYHGSQAALALYAVAMAVTLAAGGEPPLLSILLGAVVALVIGAAGGVLGSMRETPPEARNHR